MANHEPADGLELLCMAHAGYTARNLLLLCLSKYLAFLLLDLPLVFDGLRRAIHQLGSAKNGGWLDSRCCT